MFYSNTIELFYKSVILTIYIGIYTISVSNKPKSLIFSDYIDTANIVNDLDFNFIFHIINRHIELFGLKVRPILFKKSNVVYFFKKIYK